MREDHVVETWYVSMIIFLIKLNGRIIIYKKKQNIEKARLTEMGKEMQKRKIKRFVKRAMACYNTQSRAMKNQQSLDILMNFDDNKKKRKISIGTRLRNINLNRNKRSDKEEMDATDDEDDDNEHGDVLN